MLDKPSGKTLHLVDNVHASISEHLISVSNYIDNFFSNERMEEEGSKSKIILSYFVAHDGFLGTSSDYIIKARLHLPKTEGRLRLIINGRDENETDAVVGIRNSPNQNKTESRLAELKAAIQYVLLSSKLWQVNANTGLRFSVPLNPFARFRIRRLFFIKEFKLRFAESLFWYKLTGIGKSTSFDVEKGLGELFFFRSSSRVTAIKDTNELSFSQSFSIFQDISRKKILIYSIGSNADLNLPATMSTYYINTRYRHNFYKRWAFYEVVPSLFFERFNEFKTSPGILLRLDVVLG